MRTVNELIKDINALKSNLHEKDFLLTWEQSPDELKLVLDLAEALKPCAQRTLRPRFSTVV